ncbi:MAG: acyl transferase [Saprospiraceae bacterium]|nr:acyl transferase [Saprospiraceae bacterium]
MLSLGRLASDGGDTEGVFDGIALEVFAYQYKYNAFYRQYCSMIGKEFSKVSTIGDIPFLPIQFFKNQIIKTGDWADAETVFTSSGTTGAATSRHYVRHLAFYNDISIMGFEEKYGSVAEYCVLGLLPSYLERSGSSLIAMVDMFIKRSKYPQSGFFLNNHAELAEILRGCAAQQIPTLLIGVSFGLLDFVETHTIDFPELIVMETGGMKGRRREMIRQELHQELQKGFNCPHIHSEYGMTELFSQAYSKHNGLFEPTLTMKVFTREINDPLSIMPQNGQLGVIDVVDLGNLDTCSFIATDDLGRVYPQGHFEVLGRLDNSDMRGCNLLVVG